VSEIDLSVKHEQVIPTITTEVFHASGGESFAVGMLAVGSEILPGLDEEYLGYLRLRANVYARQTRMIPLEAVKEDGTETDEDDARSIHWAVFERAEPGPSGLSQARVVGAIRAIIKNEERSEPLPIEDFFREELDLNLGIGAVEVSRYIARHEDKRVQNVLNDPLFRSVVSYVTVHELGPTYGVVEEDVEKKLKDLHVPIARIADPKYVREYSADNLGIEVYIDKMASFWGMDSDSAKKKLAQNEKDIKYFNIESGIIEELKAA